MMRRVLYARFNGACRASPDALNVSLDYAYNTAGVLNASSGKLRVTDAKDPVSLLGFPAETKYAYTGVPWAAPHVGKVTATAPGLGDGSVLPLDGGP